MPTYQVPLVGDTAAELLKGIWLAKGTSAVFPPSRVQPPKGPI